MKKLSRTKKGVTLEEILLLTAIILIVFGTIGFSIWRDYDHWQEYKDGQESVEPSVNVEAEAKMLQQINKGK